MLTSTINPYPAPGREPSNPVQARVRWHLSRADALTEGARRSPGTPLAAAALARAARADMDADAMVAEHDA